MPLGAPVIKTSKPDVFAVDFAIKPGDTRIDVTYTVPYTEGADLAGKVVSKDENTYLIVPNGVTLKGDGLNDLGAEPRTQAHIFGLTGAAYKVQLTGAVAAAPADASGGDQAADDSGPRIEQIMPRVNSKTVSILIVALGILALGFALLYRASPPAPGANRGRQAMNAVGVEGVWKFYGDYPALRNVELSAAPGACLALIGRNGAGKTTLLRTIAGFSRPGKGKITIFGNSPRDTETRRLMGFIGHGISVYDELSALENLTLFGKLYGLRRSQEIGAGVAGAHRPGTRARTAWCASFRAACGSGWRWRAPFCTGPGCCCWTNRSRRSTTAPSRCCSGCCARRWPKARPS